MTTIVLLKPGVSEKIANDRFRNAVKYSPDQRKKFSCIRFRNGDSGQDLKTEKLQVVELNLSGYSACSPDLFF
jgi:hypothetical protein